jgi:IS30 family transposase
VLAIHVKLQSIVASKLILDWSPEQISGWLKIEYSQDESMRVSHETIYRSLFIQARGVLKKELVGHLRSRRRIRRLRHSRVSGHRSGQIVDALSIRERPAEIEDRAIPGHWEGMAAQHIQAAWPIGRLTEESSRMTSTMASRFDGRKAGKARRQAIAKKAAPAPRSVAFTDGQGNPMLYIPQKEKLHHLK